LPAEGNRKLAFSMCCSLHAIYLGLLCGSAQEAPSQSPSICGEGMPEGVAGMEVDEPFDQMATGLLGTAAVAAGAQCFWTLV
jgi:hypothetical protein